TEAWPAPEPGGQPTEAWPAPEPGGQPTEAWPAPEPGGQPTEAWPAPAEDELGADAEHNPGPRTSRNEPSASQSGTFDAGEPFDTAEHDVEHEIPSGPRRGVPARLHMPQRPARPVPPPRARTPKSPGRRRGVTVGRIAAVIAVLLVAFLAWFLISLF